MLTTRIAAGEFKAKCLALLDEVNDNRSEIIITKRGKPVARLVPLPLVKPKKNQVWGRLKGQGEILGDIFSTGEKWEAWDGDD